jgi:predicted O-linked N-acetylglucosamine transferase (SPINDLY family)
VLTVTGARAADRIRASFEACGIVPERLDIRPRITHDAFLAVHREVDIALDTFPYHGTTTTCFSLWMGLPVLVLAGATHVSRVGLSLLSSVGLAQFATASEVDYIATAVRWASNLNELAELRRGLRRRLLGSPLTDGAACASHLERAYRQMWLRWCTQFSPDATS